MMTVEERDRELDLIHAIIAWCDQHERDEVERRKVPERAFRDMLKNGIKSEKQRMWIRGVYERLFDEPVTENLWSNGKVPRGESLATPVPEVLRKPLPKKPPGRM